MKKIIIAAMLVLSGMLAHSATVNWNANAIQPPSGGTAAAGWLVQVYTSDVVFSYDAAKAGEISTWASAATVAAGTTFRATGSGTQSNGSTVSYYAVVYDSSTVADAQNYIVSTPVSVTVSEGGASTTLNFGAMTVTTLAGNKFANSTWEPVPEPTSGLLLLVGGALLALRRKQK